MSFLIKIILFKMNIDILQQKMVNIDSSLVYCVFSGRVNILWIGWWNLGKLSAEKNMD